MKAFTATLLLFGFFGASLPLLSADTPQVTRLAPGLTYLKETMKVGPSARAVVIEGAADGSTVLSGAEVVSGLRFAPSSDAAEAKRGVMVAAWRPATTPDQLFVNGVKYRMARYPNANPGEGRDIFDVWRMKAGARGELDALAPDRVAGWAHPEGAYLHALHAHMWGSKHWRIRGRKADGSLDLEGGCQNHPSKPHPIYRFVENVREELDAPGEWFYDPREGRLAVIPTEGTDLSSALIETVRLEELLSVRGEAGNPVRDVTVRNVTFRQCARTFMKNDERLLRADWTICRIGAVTVSQAENVRFENCRFLDLGGNALVVDGYAKDVTVTGSLFREIGASGVAIVGRLDASRLSDANAAKTDRTPGPASENYPRDCLVDDCLFLRMGREEKQVAGVTIDIAARITVRDCTVAEVPRAGINIGDGCFGGHLVEGCDVFDTVLETSDHGAFNSWGRDRFWVPRQDQMDDLMERDPDLVRADCTAPNVLRFSRWRCDHGWDVDLDDGSSFYFVVSNVCLHGGIKLREGFRRTVRGNFCANNGPHPHCWLKTGGDVVEDNVFFALPAPAGRTAFVTLKADDTRNTYVKPGEESRHPLPTGRRFGVRSESLRRLAPSPRIDALVSACNPPKAEAAEIRRIGRQTWRRFDAKREFSAYGLSFDTVAWFLDAGAEAPFENGDLLLGDPSRLGETAEVIRKQERRTLKLR